MVTQEKQFDLFLFNPFETSINHSIAELIDKKLEDNFWSKGGFFGMNISLSKAQGIAKMLRSVGAYVQIVPSDYRIPKITQQEAAKTALSELKRIQTENPVEEMSELFEQKHHEPMWWCFRSDLRREQHDEGRIPGCVFLNVDKLDGHIRSNSEFEEWSSWQGFHAI